MDRVFGDERYTTCEVDDAEQGCSGLELHRTCRGKTDRVAQVLYWDASGHFFVATFGVEVPVDIIEDLIAETKTSIKLA
jgi:hypothetical protein